MPQNAACNPPPTRQPRTESARLDNFVDGAFAFAITLLVISGGSLPSDIAALGHALRGVPAFAACVAQLALFWHGHVRWRDSLQLADGTSLVLSLVLVFFALIFVFPLHLVYASFFNGVSGGALSPDFSAADTDWRGMTWLFTCYGLSHACMAGTLVLLFRHGVRTATLAHAEAVDARVQLRIWVFFALIGLLSSLCALTTLVSHSGWSIALAGFSYALLGFTGVLERRSRRQLHAALPP